jgi:hypothetical protein
MIQDPIVLDEKHQWFDGKMYRLTGRGYFGQSSKVYKRLHRDVWIANHGPLPRVIVVHHKNGNKADNRLDNLEAMTNSEHMRLHGSMLTEEEREARRRNMRERAVPAAKEWHSTPEGHEWHKEHARKVASGLKFYEKTCRWCGGTYQTRSRGTTGYCSNNCKMSIYRRKRSESGNPIRFKYIPSPRAVEERAVKLSEDEAVLAELSDGVMLAKKDLRSRFESKIGKRRFANLILRLRVSGRIVSVKTGHGRMYRLGDHRVSPAPDADAA